MAAGGVAPRSDKGKPVSRLTQRVEAGGGQMRHFECDGNWTGARRVLPQHEARQPPRRHVERHDAGANIAFGSGRRIALRLDRAAAALDTTQAAISLKLKRLEDRLGHRLIERTPRLVRPSAQGAAFLDAARSLLAAEEHALASLVEAPHRLVIGISDHVAGPELPTLLSRLGAHDPGLVTEIRIAASRELLVAFDRGELDAILARREDERRDGEVLMAEPFGWFAAPIWQPVAGQKLRLASLAAPCSVRAMATRALDIAGVEWVEVFVGGGVAAVGAAVMAGLGVAALAHRVAPAGAVEIGERRGLPQLPPSEVLLLSNVSDPRSRAALRILAAAFRGHR
jgi:DNA-binding transcriptional LysR family regulator